MKLFLCAIPMVWAASVAIACQDHPASLDLRDAIYSYEIDRVETMLSDGIAAQNPDDARCLYSHFSAMRPKTAEFVTHWLDRHPGSPQAKAAKALSLIKFSEAMRGSRPASLTYLGALAEAHQMQEDAKRLALDAKAAKPDLIPALDVLERLRITTHNGAFFEPRHASALTPAYPSNNPEALKHAPVDPQLVNELRATAETPAEHLDYAARLLFASPYEPDHWQAYLAAHTAMHPISYADGEPYRINQLVFANHSPKALKRYILEKLETLETANTKLGVSDATIDILCPAIRAIRLHQHVCSLARDAGCQISQISAGHLNELVQRAGQQGLCFDARHAPPSALPFQPIDVPELKLASQG